MIERGDLVKWHTNAWVFKAAGRHYRSPGIVLRRLHRTGNQAAWEVLWADGKITNEFVGYLKKI